MVEIPEREMFSPEHLHDLELEGLGHLEAFPNGDALKYADLLELDRAPCARWAATCCAGPATAPSGRPWWTCASWTRAASWWTATRWTGAGSCAPAWSPSSQYRPGERDVAVLRVEARGLKDGRRTRVLTQCVDYRDLDSGFTAMSRTVGYTASIGAQLIAGGELARRGLLSPVPDVPFEILAGRCASGACRWRPQPGRGFEPVNARSRRMGD